MGAGKLKQAQNSIKSNLMIAKPTKSPATLSHHTILGKMAAATAKAAAEGEERMAEPAYLREAGLSYSTRKTAEARSKATDEWIRARVGRGRRHPPQRWEASEGASESQKGAGRSFLPASVRTRGNG